MVRYPCHNNVTKIAVTSESLLWHNVFHCWTTLTPRREHWNFRCRLLRGSIENLQLRPLVTIIPRFRKIKGPLNRVPMMPKGTSLTGNHTSGKCKICRRDVRKSYTTQLLPQFGNISILLMLSTSVDGGKNTKIFLQFKTDLHHWKYWKKNTIKCCP